MSDPPRTPAETISGIILWLSMTLDGHSTWGKLARPLALLIMDRVRAIRHQFVRLADRIGAGTYAPRRSAPSRSKLPRKPCGPRKLPQSFGWVVKLVLETAPYGSQLQVLLATPEMAALMAAAPASARRPLRSLCRMLGVIPPPVLALPITAKPAKPEPPAAAPAAECPIPSPRQPPRNQRSRASPPPTPRACGLPLPQPT